MHQLIMVVHALWSNQTSERLNCLQAAGFATTPMDPESQEDLAISMATKMASYTSRASMGVVVIGGVVRFLSYTWLSGLL